MLRRRAGLVCPKCNVGACKDPIVTGIFEDVLQRHGGIAEAMDEESFKLALEKVEGYQSAREGLRGRRRGRVWEDVRSKGVDQWVNEKRAQILDDENRLPCYLRTFCDTLEKAYEVCGLCHSPRSFTLIVLSLFKPALSTVKSLALGMTVLLLASVIRSRCCDILASADKR